MNHTLALDIGGTKYQMAVFAGAQIVARHSEQTDRAGGREWMLPRLIAQAQHWQHQYAFDRCGISFGGPVCFNRQQVAQSTHVGGWSDFDLPGFIRERLGLPTLMDNDANIGALGEARHGAGRGFDPLFYMTLSTGIGGGILIDGTVYHGADSYAGEFGHANVRPDGPECLCGHFGCLERMCGGLWLERDYGRPARELMKNPEFVRRYVVDLARGLKHVIMILNPARIVIGGGISKAGDRLFIPLREELGRQITAWSRARIDVVPAEQPDDCVLYGAMELARELV